MHYIEIFEVPLWKNVILELKIWYGRTVFKRSKCLFDASGGLYLIKSVTHTHYCTTSVREHHYSLNKYINLYSNTLCLPFLLIDSLLLSTAISILKGLADSWLKQG